MGFGNPSEVSNTDQIASHVQHSSSFTLANYPSLTTTAGDTGTDISSTSSPTTWFSYYRWSGARAATSSRRI